jgi:hypothetical protein
VHKLENGESTCVGDLLNQSIFRDILWPLLRRLSRDHPRRRGNHASSAPPLEGDIGCAIVYDNFALAVIRESGVAA